jgi:hypothetical protein
MILIGREPLHVYALLQWHLPLQSSSCNYVIFFLLDTLFLTPFLRPSRRATRVVGRRAPVLVPLRSMTKLPFGLDKILGLGEPDNLIATERERKTHIRPLPDFVPEDVKKDMNELGLDDIHDLDEMEEKNMEGYNDLGLVPPEGAGSFASPILIPSRCDSRVVGYCDPETHAMFWFTIQNDNNTYYIKDLGLFFKMLHIPDEDASAHH